MTTIIYVNFAITITGPTPWSFNFFSSFTVQELTADLNDDINVGTGYSLDITTAFDGNIESAAVATAGAGSWPEAIFEGAFFSNDTAALQIGGLNDGDTFSLELAGHTANAARDTNFTVTPANEGETLYDNAGTGVPNPPIIFTGTIGAAGTIDITGLLVDTFWYINAFKLTLTAGGAFLPASHSTVMIRI